MGAAAGITALVMKTATAADDLDELSQKTGISIEKLQELSYMGKQNGIDLDTMTGSLSRMIRNMALAEKPTSAQALAFRELGVNVTDNNGKLRDSETVWFEAIGALGNIKDETERDAVAMQIFGKSAMELNPLILAGADGMKSMATEAHKMGAVLSDEDVKAAADLRDKVDGLKAGLQGLAMKIAGVFVPAFSNLATTATTYLQQFVNDFKDFRTEPEKTASLVADTVGRIAGQLPKLTQAGLKIVQTLLSAMIKALPQLMPVVVQIISALVTFITTNLPLLIGAGITIMMALVNGLLPQIPLLIQAGWQMLLALVNGILQSLPQLLIAAQSILTGLLSSIVTNLPLLIGAGVQIMLMIVQFILNNLPALITAAIQIIVALAQGIAQAIPTLIPAVVKIIPQVVTTLIANLPLLITAALQIIMALAQGLIASLPTLIEAIPQLVTTIVEQLISLAPQLLTSALTLITTLVTGLVNNLPKIGAAAGKIIQTIVDGVGKLGGKLLSVGQSIVEGVWQGISNAWSWFWGKVKGFFDNIISGVTGALKAHSPSMVFADIGNNMALGLGLGFTDSLDRVQRDINKAMSGLTTQANLAVAPAMVSPSASGGQAWMQASGSKGTVVIENVNIGDAMDLEAFKAMLVEALR